MELLSQRFGPFPLWVWGVVVIGGIVLYIIIRRMQGPKSAAASTSGVAGATTDLSQGNTNIDPNTGIPFQLEEAVDPATGVPYYFEQNYGASSQGQAGGTPSGSTQGIGNGVISTGGPDAGGSGGPGSPTNPGGPIRTHGWGGLNPVDPLRGGGRTTTPAPTPAMPVTPGGQQPQQMPKQFVHPASWPAQTSTLSGISQFYGVPLNQLEGFPENQYIPQRESWNLIRPTDVIRIH